MFLLCFCFFVCRSCLALLLGLSLHFLRLSSQLTCSAEGRVTEKKTLTLPSSARVVCDDRSRASDSLAAAHGLLANKNAKKRKKLNSLFVSSISLPSLCPLTLSPHSSFRFVCVPNASTNASFPFRSLSQEHTPDQDCRQIRAYARDK